MVDKCKESVLVVLVVVDVVDEDRVLRALDGYSRDVRGIDLE